jgi:hypothetical protein
MCAYLCVHMFCMCASMCVLYGCMDVCMYVRMYVCMYVWMDGCLHGCTNDCLLIESVACCIVAATRMVVLNYGVGEMLLRVVVVWWHYLRYSLYYLR